MTQYEKDILWAASQFLYEDLPEDYEKWSDEKFFDSLKQQAVDKITILQYIGVRKEYYDYTKTIQRAAGQLQR